MNFVWCKHILAVSAILCVVLSHACADDKPITPATKTRLIVLGDHWVYDINYRTPKNKNNADEGGVASLFNINASDNFRQVLDMKVVSIPPTKNSADDSKGTAPDSTDASSDPPNPDAQPEDTDTKDSNSFGKNAYLFVLLCNLKYKVDGKDFNKFAKFLCAEDPDDGSFVMEETTSLVAGLTLPKDWSLGSQWTAYFPYSLLTLTLEPQSATSMIVDKQRIKIKDSSYDTWKVSQSSAQDPSYTPYTFSAPTDKPSSSDYWFFDPSVAFPVKAEVSYTNGASWTLTLNKFEAGKSLPALPTPAKVMPPPKPPVAVHPAVWTPLDDREVAVQGDYAAPEFPKGIASTNIVNSNVVVSFVVDERGNATKINILEGSGDVDVDNALKKSVRDTLFLPAVKDHHFQEAHVNHTFVVGSG